MKSKIQIRKVVILLGIMLFLSDTIFAEGWTYSNLSENNTDTTLLLPAGKKGQPNSLSSRPESLSFPPRFIHKFGVEFRPEYIIPTNPFLAGENYTRAPLSTSLSAHLKYSFQPQFNTLANQIYGGAYQGIGLAYYSFGNRKELGDPVALYLFQGARIARLTHRLSINYEWNFGISSGWNPYDSEKNPNNVMVGSKVNAYLNAGLYLSWMLSSQVDLTSGITLTHFSNGNTSFPNAGLNAVGLKVGLAYTFNSKDNFLSKPLYRPPLPKFPRHISYDLVLFGAWRRKGVVFGEKEVASPDAYTVLGFNFAPMYNIGYKFRVGVSADGVYDGSANVYTEDYIVGTTQEFFKPSITKQLALGISGRAEYVMPYFTVGIGLGVNVLHGGGDLRAFYQVLALKTQVTRNSFIHIGYSLQNFHTPNFLMLGIGFRFNNKYPTFRR